MIPQRRCDITQQSSEVLDAAIHSTVASSAWAMDRLSLSRDQTDEKCNGNAPKKKAQKDGGGGGERPQKHTEILPKRGDSEGN